MADATRRRRKSGFFNETFCGRARVMLESPAYRVLSRAAFMVMTRLEIAYSYDGRRPDANGKLCCIYRHFEEYGVHKDAISPALRELVALGFIKVTHKGAGGNAEFRDPSLYGLTFLPTEFAGPTHEWRAFETIKDAEQAAKAARAASDRAFVARGKKQNFAPDFRPILPLKTGGENPTCPPPKTGSSVPPRKPGVALNLGQGPAFQTQRKVAG
jgi:hypothetical protein